MNQDSHLAVGHAVEIIGKVDQNLQVKVQAVTDFGTNIGTCSSPTSLLYPCRALRTKSVTVTYQPQTLSVYEGDMCVFVSFST